jgi:hypothetical protein
MDLFRKMKKPTSNPPPVNGEPIENSSHSLHITDVENPSNDDVSPEDAMMQSIDDLVDSSEEADIFDDDDDDLDETPSKSITGSLSASSTKSPGSLQDLAKNLGGTSPFLSIPKTVQHGAKNDFDGPRDLASSKSSSVGSVNSADELSSDDDDDDDDKPRKKDDDDDDDKGSDSAEDYTDDEDEGQDGYKPGGYHPVKVGEVYNQR